jgi:hypothetical protein
MVQEEGIPCDQQYSAQPVVEIVDMRACELDARNKCIEQCLSHKSMGRTTRFLDGSGRPDK